MNKCSVIVILMLCVGCSNYGQLSYVAKLPKKLDENSGMVHLSDSTVWMINDSGGADKIYQVSFKGELLKAYHVGNAKNKDWEDLAKDEDDNVYIADTGNNNNRRKNLVIYKIPNPETEKGEVIHAQKIELSYPEQKKFPPKKKNLKYDAEALFYREGSLYLLTKNRAHPFDGEALIYKVPAKKGKHKASLIGSFTPCEEYASCRITSADISPDGEKIVLLSYGKLWVFTEFSEDDFTKGTIRFIDLGATTQLESVSFMDNHTLLLSDEQRAGTGRNLYSYSLE
ncbi:MAG: hypothetical protein ABF293_12165 [Flavobacteriaceae bacterium]